MSETKMKGRRQKNAVRAGEQAPEVRARHETDSRVPWAEREKTLTPAQQRGHEAAREQQALERSKAAEAKPKAKQQEPPKKDEKSKADEPPKKDEKPKGKD